MVRSYVAIDTAAGTSVPLVETIRGVDAVSEAHVVAGDFDLIAELEGETVRDVLVAVTSEIRGLDGVGTTRCYVCLE